MLIDNAVPSPKLDLEVLEQLIWITNAKDSPLEAVCTLDLAALKVRLVEYTQGVRREQQHACRVRC